MKLHILRRQDNGESVNKITLDLGVGWTTVGSWKRILVYVKRMYTNSLKEEKNIKGGEYENGSCFR